VIIGLTFDLRSDYLAQGYSAEAVAEFDSPETIEAIETVLRDLGHQPRRLGNIKDLVGRLATGERWDLVFNIAEGLLGEARESQVPAVLDAYAIPYVFSGPLVLAVTLDKGLCKRVVRAAGVPTADFAVLREPEDIARLDLDFPLFVKPVAEGTGKGITEHSLVRTRKAVHAACATIWREFRQPALAETWLPGAEVTAGIIGTGQSARCAGVMEVLFSEQAPQAGYTYETKQRYEERVSYRLASPAAAAEASACALAAWRALGCRDGGRVDLRADATGRFQFLEVNPLAGLHPVHSDLPILCRLNGMDYKTLITAILDATLERLAGIPGDNAL